MVTNITTHFVSDYQFESVNESGNRLQIDMLPAEEKEHFSPMQLVLAAVGSCAAVDLVGMIKKRRRTVTALRVETSGRRRDEIPKRFVEIHLRFVLTSPDANEEELGKLVTLAVEKYCSVSATLAQDADLTYSWTVERENIQTGNRASIH
ncbi:OsmC family protein [Cesiribacter sp. SM1]|uniref:OsmC family protein n=1 Tax=Cesiribacter sp. SM1 TaxID=2861196 RepID=UPI001CD7D91B|nr:OsmC family protein [Cesiribacter sp. SM1]